MWLKSVFIFGYLSVSLADSLVPPITCRHPASRICILQNVNYVGYRLPRFPNLDGKHTLQIRSGNVTRFSKELSENLGGVTKIVLGRLEIKSLFVKPTWLFLSAESNKIEELIVEKLVEHDVQRDEPEEPVTLEPENDNVEADPGNVHAEPDPEIVRAEDNPPGSYQLQLLNLKDNQLRNIREVSAFRNLKELLLDRNQIEFLEMDFFREMKSLKRLSLAGNRINHILTNDVLELPMLEVLSLQSNSLAKLAIEKWKMLQLAELYLSHNQLVTLDAVNFDQFVSLEKLAIADNQWYCFWLNKALNELSSKYITLADQDEECTAMPIERICCSMTVVSDDQPTLGNLFDRTKHLNTSQSLMREAIHLKVKRFEDSWKQSWRGLEEIVGQREKRLEAASRDPKDSGKIKESDVQKLQEELNEINDDIEELKSQEVELAKYEKKFTTMHYMVIEGKNNLFAAMRNASQLEDEMKELKQSFDNMKDIK